MLLFTHWIFLQSWQTSATTNGALFLCFNKYRYNGLTLPETKLFTCLDTLRSYNSNGVHRLHYRYRHNPGDAILHLCAFFRLPRLVNSSVKRILIHLFVNIEFHSKRQIMRVGIWLLGVIVYRGRAGSATSPSGEPKRGSGCSIFVSVLERIPLLLARRPRRTPCISPFCSPTLGLRSHSVPLLAGDERKVCWSNLEKFRWQLADDRYGFILFIPKFAKCPGTLNLGIFKLAENEVQYWDCHFRLVCQRSLFSNIIHWTSIYRLLSTFSLFPSGALAKDFGWHLLIESDIRYNLIAETSAAVQCW